MKAEEGGKKLGRPKAEVNLKHVKRLRVDVYPKRGPKLETGVPKEIEEEYIEAAKCFDAGAYKASVAMCRRAIQASVVAKGAKGNRLVDQINNLHDLGIITKDICDWAHEISDFGTHRYN